MPFMNWIRSSRPTEALLICSAINEWPFRYSDGHAEIYKKLKRHRYFYFSTAPTIMALDKPNCSIFYPNTVGSGMKGDLSVCSKRMMYYKLIFSSRCDTSSGILRGSGRDIGLFNMDQNSCQTSCVWRTI